MTALWEIFSVAVEFIPYRTLWGTLRYPEGMPRQHSPTPTPGVLFPAPNGSQSGVVKVPPKLADLGSDSLPAVFVAPGERAAKRFLEFFTVNIRNSHTRHAYFRAVARFGDWCDRP